MEDCRSRAGVPSIRTAVDFADTRCSSHREYLLSVATPASSIVPIVLVTEHGTTQEWARLIPADSGSYWVEHRAGGKEWHDALPWLLWDMQPQGFLGRAFARSHPELHLPDRPQDWTDAEILRALCSAGDDLPGNLIVGEEAIERFLKAPEPPRFSPRDYPALADAAMKGSVTRTIVGGDQPKFCCRRDDGANILVKFSPLEGTPSAQRWSDLLICEHLALRELIKAGVLAALTRITRAGGRTFLEVTRFDRTAEGRVGMVSLAAYDAQHVGQMDNWAATAHRMGLLGLLSTRDAGRLRLLEAFGRLIANSDRHYGNVSLLIDPSDGKWALAPAYDQLPMYYAPYGDDVPDRGTRPVAQDVHTASVWAEASKMAHSFWAAVAEHEMVSLKFRMTARALGTDLASRE